MIIKSRLISMTGAFLILLSSGFGARAGELTYREEQKNVFSLSILDQQVFYSINYDRTFNKYFGLGASTAVVGGGGNAVFVGGLRGIFYPVGSKTTAPFITAGIHGMTGDNLDSWDSLDGSYGWGAAGLGIEYRHGFVFRGSVNILFNDEGYLVPFPGFSFGYAF